MHEIVKTEKRGELWSKEGRLSSFSKWKPLYRKHIHLDLPLLEEKNTIGESI